MLIAAFVAGYLCGVVPAIFFIVGFKAKERYEDQGKFMGGVETVDPFQMTDRRVRELEEEERDKDTLLS